MNSFYPDLRNVRNILLCKLRHHGDVLLITPLLIALKNYCPQAAIDVYLYQETLPMLEGLASIRDFILYNKEVKKRSLWKRIRHELSILGQVRKKKYDLVINLTEGDRGALMALLSGASIRVGFDAERKGMWGKNRCYTHTVRICHQTRHTVERHVDVLRCLGIFPSPEERALSFSIPPSAFERVDRLLREEHIEDFILIHPVSRWLFKCLPEKTIAEILRHLAQRGHKVVLTASSDPLELAMNERIITLSGVSALHLGGKISLKELGALIARSRLMICVDSVPMHIASALQAPSLAIFGPTSEKTWAPWQNPKARVIFSTEHPCRPCYMPGCGGSGHSDCLATLTSASICKTVDEMLGAYNAAEKLYTLKSSPK